MAEGGPKADLT